MSITEALVNFFSKIIYEIGYIGVMVLMTMESMIFPVPSEAVMPFAGFLIYENKFTWMGVFTYSTLGSILGSSLSYIMGLYGGRAFVLKYGKYFLLEKEHLEFTERFFNKYGEITILISRFIPVVRHLISIPAGMARMNFYRFIVFTTIGASAWNMFLAYIGYILKSNWKEIMKYSKVIDIFVILALVGMVVYFVYHQISIRKRA
ncbi:MAG: DedA family protein [candidate division WOR-3 bacterium]|nr:DedA family protein [candidate division WOR-3 bacterium]MCX7947071.1 DedA family protein [candidate division WOR-3 bacterium]MDW8149888.1 DedA family protein [candidate division WOR-3 bacterium]